MKIKLFATIMGIAITLSGFAVLAAQAHESKDKVKEHKEIRHEGSELEINITDKGKVLVKGAKVTSVSGNKIIASASWGSSVFNWTVVTSTSTEFVRRNGGASGIAEVSVGDYISFHGILDTSIASPITVKASIVKDWSVEKKTSFFGTVKSVNASLKSFVLNTENKGDVSVKVSDTAKITKENGSGLFTDIVVGARVKVSGIYNSVSNIFTASSVKIRN